MLYLALEGIAGESRHLWHAGEIELTSFSLDITPAAQAETATWSLACALRVDTSTVRIIQACHAGQVIATACLTDHGGGDVGTDRLRITMQEVRVVQVSVAGTGHGEEVHATIQLEVERLEIEGREVKMDGSPSSGATTGPMTRRLTPHAEQP